MANDKVYIHELIDVIGHNRANYMHHMTANWSPIAQRERHQLCYGVWGTVGTTRRWPEVVNLWEEDGFDGLAGSFRHEFNHPTLQDPALADWWARAASFRRSGVDRVIVPAPWTQTIEELCADGVRGETYAHEIVQVRPGTAWDYLELVREEGAPVLGRFDWELVGAWVTAMRNDSEGPVRGGPAHRPRGPGVAVAVVAVRRGLGAVPAGRLAAEPVPDRPPAPGERQGLISATRLSPSCL
jgi:hypothetical protein